MQCKHCESWHLIVDNLNVAEEYRRDDNGEWVRWVPDPLPDPVTSEEWSTGSALESSLNTSKDDQDDDRGPYLLS